MAEVPGPGDLAAAKRLLSLARSLLVKGGALESTISGETILRTHLAEALERRIEMTAATGHLPSSLTAKAAAAQALANAEGALNKAAGGASPSNLTDLELASLEAIIEVTGRPAMRYTNGKVQMPPSDLGDNERWRVLVATARSKINRSSASVGRIAITSSGIAWPIGTGWRGPGDLIVTNRHVANQLLKSMGASQPSGIIDQEKHPVIDFAATDDADAEMRFDIAELVYCAQEQYVDLAMLRVTAGARQLPPSLAVDWERSALGSELEGADQDGPRFQGSEIYVVGHPYQPHRPAVTVAVFGAADGSKRWSPGLVVGLDPEQSVFEHDCSTLGGNSGSCVLTAGEHAVIGIHIGGLAVDQSTGRGSANLALAFSQLGRHPAREILRAGEL